MVKCSFKYYSLMIISVKVAKQMLQSQVVIFGVMSVVRSVRFGSKPLEFDWRVWGSMATANFLLTLMQILCFIAVKMLPLSDFVTLAFLEPIFTTIFSTCVYRFLFLKNFCIFFLHKLKVNFK